MITMRVTQKSKDNEERASFDAKGIFQRLKSASPPDRRSAVEDLSRDPRAKDRENAMGLIKEVTVRGSDGLAEIREIMELTTEPTLGIAALDVLEKICKARQYWNELTFLGDVFPLVEAGGAASHAVDETVAMEGLKRLIDRRYLCVRSQIGCPPSDEAERKLQRIALRGRHLSVALEALGNMRLYDDTWKADLRELELHSIHPEIREKARALMDSRAKENAGG